MRQNQQQQSVNRCRSSAGKGPVLGDWLKAETLIRRVPRFHLDTSVHEVAPELRGACSQGVFAVADDGGEVAWISAGEIGTAAAMGLMHQLPDVSLRSCRQEELKSLLLDGGIHELAERFSESGRSVLPVFDEGHCIGDLRIEDFFEVLGNVASECCRSQRAPRRRQLQLTRPFLSLRPAVVGPWINRLMRDMMDPSRAY